MAVLKLTQQFIQSDICTQNSVDIPVNQRLKLTPETVCVHMSLDPGGTTNIKTGPLRNDPSNKPKLIDPKPI